MPARDGTAGGLTMGTGGGSNAGTTFIGQTENSFTVELWVKPTSTHEIDGESDNGASGVSGQKFVIDPIWGGTGGLSTAGMGISVGTNGVSVYEHADYYMPALLVWEGDVSGWSHIAVVYENGTPRLYVNGVLKKVGTHSLKDHIHPGNLVGSGQYGTMTGDLDEVRVWKTIRTQEDIVYNMNRSVTPQQPDLTAYWPIGNNGDGATLEDVTGNGNDVTLNSSYATGSFTSSGAPVTAEEGYRYGFNGKENDKDISEAGQDYGMRIYDTRLGRFLSVDPIAKNYAQLTPYQFSSNTPIQAIDLDGKEAVYYCNDILKDSKFGKAQTLVVSTASGINSWISVWGTENKKIKQDVYITATNNESIFGEDDGAGDANAFTLTFDMRQIVNGKLTFSFEDKGKSIQIAPPEKGILNELAKIDFSQSEGKSGNVSIVVLNKTALDRKSTLKYSKTIFHEVQAHIVANINFAAFDPKRPDGDTDHEKFHGQCGEYTPSTPKKGTPSDIYNKEAESSYFNPDKPSRTPTPNNNETSKKKSLSIPKKTKG